MRDISRIPSMYQSLSIEKFILEFKPIFYRVSFFQINDS